MIAVNFRDFLGDPLWLHVNDVRVLRLTDDLKYRNPTDMENLHGTINH